MNKNLKTVLAYIKLTKPIITLSVSFSALTGFVLFSKAFADGWFVAYSGVLLIAAGSSVINQIQEADSDKLMERTRNRPIPTGIVGERQAWLWAAILSISGAWILGYQFNLLTSVLAIFTLLWYNGIYTPLKRITPWAILPGAVVGAIPPAIGWVAAGGTLLHPHIIFLSFFFFIGQIPHFWLILLRYGEDYHKAGFPSITSTFNTEQISRLTFVWTTATAIAAVFLSVFGIIESLAIALIILGLSVILVIFFYKWPGIKRPALVNRAFVIMNLYFLLIMLLIIADSIL